MEFRGRQIVRNRRTIICVITAVLTACMFLTVLPLGAAAEEGTVYYGFGKLTEEQQTIYNSVHEGIRAENPAEKIVLPAESRILPADLERIMKMYLADHPETFWFDGSWGYTESDGYVTAIHPDYRLNGAAVTAEQIKAARDAFQAELDGIDAGLKQTGLTEKKDLALWLHDETAERVSYVMNSPNSQSAYGALVDGQAVCAGYARLYQCLLQKYGIRAWTVTGSSVNPGTDQYEPHAWTLMWLGDACVYTDVTWADQDSELYHVYYGRTLTEYADTHTPDADIAEMLPGCTEACSDHLVYVEDNLFTGEITAEALHDKLTADAGGNTWTAVLYDPTGTELNEKLNDSGFMRQLLGFMGTAAYSWEWNYQDGCGTEIHLTIHKLRRISGTISSAGDPEGTVTVEMISEDTGRSYSDECTSEYELYVPAGDYVLRVSKANHVTREYQVTVN